MKPRFAPNLSRGLSFLLIMLGCLLSGCSTIASRIKERSVEFAALPLPVQEKIRVGTVELGYTPSMVYMALGNPDEIKDRTTKREHILTWIYTSTHSEYMGAAHVGYRRVLLRDPRTGATTYYLEPVYSDVYADRIQEDIRIIFHSGRVAVMEKAK